MALTTKSAGVPLIRGARAHDPQMKKAYITRDCAIRGVPVQAGCVIDCDFNELQALYGAKRGEEYDPERHKDAKHVRIQDGKLVGAGGPAPKAKAEK